MKIYFDESGQSGCVLQREDLLNFREQPTFAIGALVVKNEKNAKKIYIHSLHMLTKMPKEYIEEFKNKIILDIHGCVVEELMSENVDVKKFKDIEEFAFPRINTLIAVNNNMINFYKEKYSGIKTNFIQLPIFNSNIKNIAKDTNKNN